MCSHYEEIFEWLCFETCPAPFVRSINGHQVNMQWVIHLYFCFHWPEEGSRTPEILSFFWYYYFFQVTSQPRIISSCSLYLVWINQHVRIWAFAFAAALVSFLWQHEISYRHVFRLEMFSRDIRVCGVCLRLNRGGLFQSKESFDFFKSVNRNGIHPHNPWVVDPMYRLFRQEQKTWRTQAHMLYIKNASAFENLNEQAIYGTRSMQKYNQKYALESTV